MIARLPTAATGIWCAVLLLSLTAFVTEARAAEKPLFANDSTVIVLCGLAGDVETETAYRNQLNRLLEIVSPAATRRRIVALSDIEPQFAASNVKVMPAIRESLGAAKQAVAKAGGGVVFIVWGHGGRQGKTPVFHVKGPRITPADLSGVAGAVASSESTWLLFFKGSGAFARELAAANRTVISSDRDTPSSGDPIAWDVCLPLLRGNPEVGALASTLGRDVSAWYAERNLARLEEPTLWRGTESPRALAKDDGPSPLASVRAAEATDSNPPPAKVEAEAPEPEAKLRAATPGNAWTNVIRVAPEAFPNDDAVVLRRRVEYTIGSSPAITSRREEFIQILSAEGKRFGDFELSFSPPDEDLEILDCEVLRVDGTVVRVNPGDVHDAAESALGDYMRTRRKFFSMPGVEPGCILRLNIRTEWKRFPLPHVFLTIPISGELPVLDSLIQVSVPAKSAFHFRVENGPASEPAKKQTAYGTTYEWSFAKVASDPHEPLAPPHLAKALQVSTFPDWAAFADWYSRVITLADTATPEIEAKARELCANATSDRDKLRAIYNYVTSLRYVAVPLGVNSFRPHAAANVLRNQFGDCKDKANLFNALLRSQNIHSDLVLVPRFSQAHDELPGMAFNHAISRVKFENEGVWVDTTDEVCRLGLLPPGDPGRRVLVIDGATTQLAELPKPKSSDHVLRLMTRAERSPTGDACKATIEARAFGAFDYALRHAAHDLRRGSTAPLLAAVLRLANGGFGVATQTFTQVGALDDEFALDAEGEFIGTVLTTSEGGTQIRAPFWLPTEWEMALHRRTTPMFLNDGYPFAIEQSVEFHRDDGLREARLPATREDVGGPLAWRLEWAAATEGTIVARLTIEVPEAEIEDTAEFQTRLRRLMNALAAPAVLAR